VVGNLWQTSHLAEGMVGWEVEMRGAGLTGKRQVIGSAIAAADSPARPAASPWAVLDRASAGWRGFTMTSDGLRLLQDLRRSLLQPPRQLRPRTVTAAQPDDQPETVRATA
jgi:hypothetical protein